VIGALPDRGQQRPLGQVAGRGQDVVPHLPAGCGGGPQHLLRVGTHHLDPRDHHIPQRLGHGGPSAGRVVEHPGRHQFLDEERVAVGQVVQPGDLVGIGP
jgi:hypothetical protein